MPTNQASNAPDEATPALRDDATAAAVLSDEQMDDAPGGGGLGGAAAADRLSGSGRAPGGPSPNAPIDVITPDPAAEGATPAAERPDAERDAQVRAAAADSPEPHPRSQ